jgi:hypothetical protein
MGLSGDYSEADRESRLKSAKRLSGKNGRIIIVSHVPPRGVLDRAMRYGDEAIGSTALREFIDAEDHVPLVVCGHVHRCGGQCQTVGRTVVVNVSSHDDAFTRANMAWITISEVGEVQVEFTKLPSLLEHMLVAEQADEAKLADETRLSPNEARVFLENYRSHGSTLFDHLEGLAHMKFRYGLTWNLTFAAYARGVTQHDEMTDGVFESLGRNTQGFDHIHLRRAYAKFRREKDSGQVYLMEPLPTFPSGRTVIFDTEYVDSEHGVLFGFQDLEGGEVKQFWFDQEDGTIDYLMARQGATFVHWGGADRALLQGLRDGDAKTVNLLYKVQTSLVAPIQSASLEAVHDALCGHLEGDWWRESFYEMSGLEKLVRCELILADPADVESRALLALANRADVIALGNLTRKLMELPVSKQRRPTTAVDDLEY